MDWQVILRKGFPQADTPAEEFQLLLGLALFSAMAALAYFVVRYSSNPLQRLGPIVYLDDGQSPGFYRADLDFAGRPDMVVRAGPWFRKEDRPVEFKSGDPPSTPYDGHILQLMGSGLSIEGHCGAHPRHGYVAYEDPDTGYIVHQVSLGLRSRAIAKRFVEELRSGIHPASVPVDHRCRGCPHQGSCPMVAALRSR